MNSVLMCPPDHYDVVYAINPWVDLDKKVDKANARRQWGLLYDIYQALDLNLYVIEAEPKLYDLVFAGDSVFVHKDKVIQSRFRHEVRRPEAPLVAGWFARQGFKVIPMPDEDPYFFEGTGETLRWRNRIFSGVGVRNSIEGVNFAAKALGVEITPLRIVDERFFHLDTCLCFVSDDLVFYYPPAFDEESRSLIEGLEADVVPMSEHDAMFFGCNSIAVGETVILNRRCPETKKFLQKRGYNVLSLPIREFLKAGGGIKCLTLLFDWPKNIPQPQAMPTEGA
jgi:N-dimethylarginine dimethylaminohydrolase